MLEQLVAATVNLRESASLGSPELRQKEAFFKEVGRFWRKVLEHKSLR